MGSEGTTHPGELFTHRAMDTLISNKKKGLYNKLFYLFLDYRNEIMPSGHIISNFSVLDLCWPQEELDPYIDETWNTRIGLCNSVLVFNVDGWYHCSSILQPMFKVDFLAFINASHFIMLGK